jgi:hypothetical protein
MFSAIRLSFMTLTQQINNLVEAAPSDLQAAITALAPALAQAAIDLKHLNYLVGVGPNGQWIATTLQNRQSGQEIKVVYCFATAQDLQIFYQEALPWAELPTIDLIFQLTALDTIDQLIFFNSADFNHGHRVTRTNLQRSIEEQLKSSSNSPPATFC